MTDKRASTGQQTAMKSSLSLSPPLALCILLGNSRSLLAPVELDGITPREGQRTTTWRPPQASSTSPCGKLRSPTIASCALLTTNHSITLNSQHAYVHTWAHNPGVLSLAHGQLREFHGALDPRVSSSHDWQGCCCCPTMMGSKDGMGWVDGWTVGCVE